MEKLHTLALVDANAEPMRSLNRIATRLRKPTRRPRAGALVLSLVWAFGLVIAPLVHAGQHLRESREQDAQSALADLAKPPQPTDADLAALDADALAWQEALSAVAPIDHDLEAVFSPLVVYELERASSPSGEEPQPAHTHGFSAGHSHDHGGHSHGSGRSDEPQNPFNHGSGSLAHSGAALHATPAAALVQPAAVLGRISAAASSASCIATPSWHRPACAQSPPIA